MSAAMAMRVRALEERLAALEFTQVHLVLRVQLAHAVIQVVGAGGPGGAGAHQAYQQYRQMFHESISGVSSLSLRPAAAFGLASQRLSRDPNRILSK